jgi:hypothetical protein
LVGGARRERRAEELLVDDGADSRRTVLLHNGRDIGIAKLALRCRNGGKVIRAYEAYLADVGHEVLFRGAAEGLEAGEVGRGEFFLVLRDDLPGVVGRVAEELIAAVERKLGQSRVDSGLLGNGHLRMQVEVHFARDLVFGVLCVRPP